MTCRASFVFLLAFFLSIPSGLAAEADSPDHARIEADSYSLVIEAPTTPKLVVMNVRIIDADNQLVLRERSRGEPVQLLAIDLPDGEYSYEVVNVLDMSAEIEPGPFGSERSTRAHGRFTVQGGEIIAGRLPGGRSSPTNVDEASLLDATWSRALSMAGHLVDLVFPSAAAADLFAESEDPTVSFRDTGVGDFVWDLRAGSTVANGYFSLLDRVGSNSHEIFIWNGSNGSTSNETSLVVDSNGDFHWSNFGLNFDRSVGALSLGTQLLGGEFRINSVEPDIYFHDETGTQETMFQLSNDQVRFFSRPTDVSPFNIPVKWQVQTPTNTLVMDTAGDIGMGTAAPAASLHVIRDDGSAQILVDENNAGAAPRTLFMLSNAGNTKFEIENTQASNSWAFTNSGEDFRISLQDSGVVEFKVLNNGNAILDGTLTQNSDRAAKTAIRAIQPEQVLERVAKLPISQWQYHDSPGVDHMGPMAQDFHAAFGLGANERGISSIDTGGVAMAAIQGLNAKLEQQNRELRTELEALRALVHQVQATLGSP